MGNEHRMHIIVHKTKSRIMNEGAYDKISVFILKKSDPAASAHTGSTADGTLKKSEPAASVHSGSTADGTLKRVSLLLLFTLDLRLMGH